MVGVPRQPVRAGLSAPAVRSIPKDWDAEWFRRFITNFMQSSDVRNATAGPGIAVTGAGTAPATIATSGTGSTIGLAGYTSDEGSGGGDDSGGMVVPGPPGANGTTGAQGPAGPAIYLDAEGPEGDPGPPGPQGPQGPAGTGATGAQGPGGPAVYFTVEGDDGVDGPPGPAGAQGTTGAQGPSGFGPPGADGTDGEDGMLVIGPQGATGTTGAQGPMGPAVYLEAEGLDGMDGNPGVNGATGAQGPLGYGPPGQDGDPGDDGAAVPGPQGATGTTGAQGPMGPAVYLEAEGLDGMDGNPGVNGATGATGAQGPQNPSTGAYMVVDAKSEDGDLQPPFGLNGGPQTVSSMTANGQAVTPSVAVTFAATGGTLDCSKSNVYSMTLTANITGAYTLSNMIDGQTINWFLTQDGTGSRTVVWPTSFKWPGGTAGVLSTAINSVDLLVATYRASTGFWYCSLLKAFA